MLWNTSEGQVSPHWVLYACGAISLKKLAYAILSLKFCFEVLLFDLSVSCHCCLWWGISCVLGLSGQLGSVDCSGPEELPIYCRPPRCRARGTEFAVSHAKNDSPVDLLNVSLGASVDEGAMIILLFFHCTFKKYIWWNFSWLPPLQVFNILKLKSFNSLTQVKIHSGCRG